MRDRIEHVKLLFKALKEEFEDEKCFDDKDKMKEVYDIADELKNELEPGYWFWIKNDKENRMVE